MALILTPLTTLIIIVAAITVCSTSPKPPNTSCYLLFSEVKKMSMDLIFEPIEPTDRAGYSIAILGVNNIEQVRWSDTELVCRGDATYFLAGDLRNQGQHVPAKVEEGPIEFRWEEDEDGFSQIWWERL